MSKKVNPKRSEHRITAKATIIAALIAALATVSAALITVWFQCQSKPEITPTDNENTPKITVPDKAGTITYNVSGWIGYKESGSPKQDPIDFTTANVNFELPIPGEFTGFYLRVEQYTSGKLCGEAEMFPGHQNFPTGQGPVDASGSPGPYFYGGSQVKDGRLLQVFLHPSNQCK